MAPASDNRLAMHLGQDGLKTRGNFLIGKTVNLLRVFFSLAPSHSARSR
jgi:hypothetical protein